MIHRKIEGIMKNLKKCFVLWVIKTFGAQVTMEFHDKAVETLSHSVAALQCDNIQLGIFIQHLEAENAELRKPKNLLASVGGDAPVCLKKFGLN